MNVLRRQYEGVRRYAGSYAWGPTVQVARAAVLYIMQRVEAGALKITDVDGTVVACGGRNKGPSAELVVLKDTFWVRTLLFADMGFAESYMLGEMSCSDLTSFFEVFILNKEQMSNGTTLTSALTQAVNSIARSTNTLANARLNISAHYDLGNDMFEAFLSPDMTYSCPIWLPTSDPKSKKESLQSAQERKLQRFIDNAHIKSTDHVLEIGTGWGSFAIQAVRKTGCRVTSITLSKEQKLLAEKRIAEADLTDNIEVLLCDYRALPIPREGRYDKVVSIEMLEAVGREFLDTYFECIDKLLKPEGGIAVFQCITIPEARYEAYSKSKDFINQYIFPGGHLPSVSQLVKSIEAGAKKSLVVENIENIGPHYAKTLRLWKEEFLAQFDSRIQPCLLREHDGMTPGDIALFKRKWEYYFTYCEAGFRTSTLGDVIVTIAREGTTQLAETVPL